MAEPDEDIMLRIWGGEGSTQEERLHERLKFWESELLHRLVSVPPRLRTDGARRHVFGGVLQRHIMMQTSRLFIRETCATQVGGLSPYTATDLDIHLNAYYLNLTGALDNLAWAITYDVPLVKIVDEGEGRRSTRKFAQLTGESFLRVLAAKGFPDAAEALRGLSGWVADVKALRDPAAHRLPLRFMTAVITADRRAEYDALQAKQQEALARGDLDERRALQEQERQLARFIPALASPVPDERGLRIATNQILSDQEQFVRVTTHVLNEILDRPPAESAEPAPVEPVGDAAPDSA